jgi:pyruvate kinase
LHFLCKTPQDLKDLQNLIENIQIPIIAKIEMPEALENIDKIVAYCGLMVARGDLGVELPAHEVPLVQKIDKSKNGKNSSYCCYPNDGDNDYQFNSYKS